MNQDPDDDQLSEIEQSQQGLRECIEETKRLAERSDAILHRHRGDAPAERPGS